MKHHIFLFLLLTTLPASLYAQKIITIAGNGSKGYSGDNGKATSAMLNNPTGMAEDNDGNIYIADQGNNMVRKVDRNSNISVFAGTGKEGYSGDNGKAINSTMKWPNDVKVDAKGNVLIVDEGNNCIRKVSKTGIISTIIGNGNAGFSGDGGPATKASLLIPTSLAIDSVGNIFLADAGNERIRKIDKMGIIRTFAGNGIKGYSGDGGKAWDAQIEYVNGIAAGSENNLYFAQKDDNVIRKIDKNGIISTIAGTGKPGFSGDYSQAINATLNNPYGITVDNENNLYVADNGNARIRKIDNKGIITTIGGNGKAGFKGENGLATYSSFNYIAFVSMSKDNNLLVADKYNNRIRKMDICRLPKIRIPNSRLHIGEKMKLPDVVKGAKWSTKTGVLAVSPDGYVTGISEGTSAITYTIDNDCGETQTIFRIDVKKK